MLIVQEIDKICDTYPGITQIFITDPQNLDETNLNPAPGAGPGAPIPEQGPNIYEIKYRDYEADYVEEMQTGPGGDYAEKTIKFYLPMKRAAVQHLIRQCANRHVAIIAYDRYANQITIPYGKLSYKYSTGKKFGDNEGYDVTVRGVDLLKDFIILPENENPVAENLQAPGEQTSAELQPIGNGGVSAQASCCVTVNLIQLSYVPPLTGNTTIVNQIVKGSDGVTYFIDHQGTAAKIHSDTAKVRYEPPTSGPLFDLPPDWQVNDPEKDLLIIRNGVVQKITDSLSDINQVIANGGQVAISPSWPLESGEYLDVIRIN